VFYNLWRYSIELSRLNKKLSREWKQKIQCHPSPKKKSPTRMKFAFIALTQHELYWSPLWVSLTYWKIIFLIHSYVGIIFFILNTKHGSKVHLNFVFVPVFSLNTEDLCLVYTQRTCVYFNHKEPVLSLKQRTCV
jgi:hypothetical protein